MELKPIMRKVQPNTIVKMAPLTSIMRACWISNKAKKLLTCPSSWKYLHKLQNQKPF